MKNKLESTWNDITLRVLNIKVNKEYNCKNADCWDYKEKRICTEKKHFNLNATAQCNLIATEVEIILENNSSSDFRFREGYLRIIDADHFAYNPCNLCDELITRHYSDADQIEIWGHTQIKTIITFPQIESSAISQIIYAYQPYHNSTTCKFSIEVAPFNDESEEDFAKRVNECTISNLQPNESIEVSREIHKLKMRIFSRLNNILTRTEKIKLENEIQNTDFLIRTKLSLLNPTEKDIVEKELDVLMSNYKERLVPASPNSTTVWERASNEGTRADLGETVFRSSWEANIARVLNYLGISWTYETTHYDLGDIQYLPDFFLSDGGILEVKGFWDNDSISKVEAFLRTNRDVQYHIIDHDIYPDIANHYATIIPNWETTTLSKEYKVNVVIVGLSFLQDKSVLDNIKVGDTVQMVAEPTNAYDPFAIAIQTLDGKSVGHLEKRFAPIYAEKIKMGLSFAIEITSIEKKILRGKAFRSNNDTPLIPSIFLK